MALNTSKCNRMTILGFKGLRLYWNIGRTSSLLLSEAHGRKVGENIAVTGSQHREIVAVCMREEFARAPTLMSTKKVISWPIVGVLTPVGNMPRPPKFGPVTPLYHEA